MTSGEGIGKDVEKFIRTVYSARLNRQGFAPREEHLDILVEGYLAHVGKDKRIFDEKYLVHSIELYTTEPRLNAFDSEGDL